MIGSLGTSDAFIQPIRTDKRIKALGRTLANQIIQKKEGLKKGHGLTGSQGT